MVLSTDPTWVVGACLAEETMKMNADTLKPLRISDGVNGRIGLALGGGAARGWAHIGVIRALAEIGIKPDIVAGTSIGALVGAAYAGEQLDALERWVTGLNWKDIPGYLDLSLLSGGFIQGEKLLELARGWMKDLPIEALPRRFGMVATELDTGREIWFREGPLFTGVRASMGLPGLFAPVKVEGRWLVDGGLTNPVPVSLCRAMGAEVVIAVNLNGDIVGKHGRRRNGRNGTADAPALNPSAEADFWNKISTQFKNGLNERKQVLLGRVFGTSLDAPGLFDVLASSINIMQDRITRSRMAGDPPEVMLAPRLSQLGLMEFHLAAVAIAEGRASVQRMRPALEQVIQGL